MKRIAILAVLLIAGTAAAATDGTYSQGNTNTGSGVRMTVSHSVFAIKIVRFKETCRFGSKTFHDYFTFRSGTLAKITGPVAADDSFLGKYVAKAGTVKVSGSFSGPAATIRATESGPYDFTSPKRPNFCSGRKTFQANLPTG